MLLLAGCSRAPVPEGGTRPDFAAIPSRPAADFSPSERQAVLDNLTVDRAEAAHAFQVIETRLGRRDTVPPPADLPSAPITGAPVAPVPPVAAAPPLIGGGLVGAQGLVALERAVREDRRLLERRLALLEPPPPPPDAPRMLTALVFAPGSVELSALEQERLRGGLERFGSAGEWSVAVHGDSELARARAAVVRGLLLDAGIDAERVAVVDGDRQVDLAEVRVRR
ncbi:MAG: hypothetical protein EA356_15240 [Geminicoccaceae bacterium]|nr:MAG: hypothetical protein EA356_15240 [Geminicoccaceae bacterium]